MPIVTELVVSIVGGVITAVILAMFSGRGRSNVTSVTAGESGVPAARPRQAGAISGFLRMLVAVCGGVFVAMVLGRFLIQAGYAPRGSGIRLILLVAATALIWMVLPFGRRRH